MAKLTDHELKIVKEALILYAQDNPDKLSNRLREALPPAMVWVVYQMYDDGGRAGQSINGVCASNELAEALAVEIIREDIEGLEAANEYYPGIVDALQAGDFLAAQEIWADPRSNRNVEIVGTPVIFR